MSYVQDFAAWYLWETQVHITCGTASFLCTELGNIYFRIRRCFGCLTFCCVSLFTQKSSKLAKKIATFIRYV